MVSARLMRARVRVVTTRIRLPGACSISIFRMFLHIRRTPPGFIQPCLPSPAERPLSGPGWTHEIKHDGFRMMVRRDAAGVRLLTRHGYDWSDRFPLIAEAAGALGALVPCRREAVTCDGDGQPSFDRLRYRRGDGSVF